MITRRSILGMLSAAIFAKPISKILPIARRAAIQQGYIMDWETAQSILNGPYPSIIGASITLDRPLVLTTGSVVAFCDIHCSSPDAWVDCRSGENQTFSNNVVRNGGGIHLRLDQIPEPYRGLIQQDRNLVLPDEYVV
jgi:hypothetical protein